MSDDQNTTSTESENTEVGEENQDSEASSLPASPQEPTEPTTENTMDSETIDMPSEAPESSPSDFEVKSSDTPPPDYEPEIENPDEKKMKKNQKKVSI